MTTLLLQLFALLACPFPVYTGYLGDSILAGTLVTTKPPTYIQGLKPALVPQFNYAVSGHTAADCVADWNASVRGNAALVLVISCGINSIHTGVSEASIEAALDEIATEANADGIHIAWATMTPCATYSGCSAGEVVIWSAVNAHIVTTCAALGRCHLVNAAATFNNGSNGMRADCDNGDGLHLNNACTIEFANAIAAALP